MVKIIIFLKDYTVIILYLKIISMSKI